MTIFLTQVKYIESKKQVLL